MRPGSRSSRGGRHGAKGRETGDVGPSAAISRPPPRPSENTPHARTRRPIRPRIRSEVNIDPAPPTVTPIASAIYATVEPASYIST